MSDFEDMEFHYAPLHGDRELRPIALAAVCDMDETLTDNLRPSISVKITQCILMSDGSMISLDLARGFTAISHGPGPARWRRSSDELIAEILDLVRVDDPENPGEHPWDEIAAAAQSRGIEIDAAQLKQLPYQVLLSDKVIRTFEI
ncbi:hypothetical protein [Glutamicibacter sp. HZAU]|uniref:hypothetical protein n=1 Tax=Glutamicibacter sp. HZAU TaxID=2049891 RepID=UPI000FFB9A9F|nr:hypothetical protein [Glutamicibacter sp. HZAU]MDV2982279.1 hypothetical protein [Actinomycetes bacterium ARC8]RWZ82075.1 hypothetical protein EKH49_15045 [Glutamicibacter sp. HZAU]